MSWLSKIVSYVTEQATLARMYNRHLAEGSKTPWLDTTRELHYRAFVLLPFRDAASAAYLHDGTDLDASKEVFIRDHLGPDTSAYDAHTTAMLRDVINDMTPESAFHPDALARYNDEIDAFAEEMIKEHRRQFGRGHHPNVPRVLRGTR